MPNLSPIFKTGRLLIAGAAFGIGLALSFAGGADAKELNQRNHLEPRFNAKIQREIAKNWRRQGSCKTRTSPAVRPTAAAASPSVTSSCPRDRGHRVKSSRSSPATSSTTSGAAAADAVLPDHPMGMRSMTVRTLILGAVLSAAVAGMAAATVVNESGPPVGAKSGAPLRWRPAEPCACNAGRTARASSTKPASVTRRSTSSTLRTASASGAAAAPTRWSCW